VPAAPAAKAPDGAKKAKPPTKVEFVNRDYQQGTVTAVTRDSITIQSPEMTRMTQRFDPDGVKRWVTEVLQAQPPKQFAVSEVLAAGGVPMEPRGSYRVFEDYMYRLTDVKVGDWVNIKYARVDGVNTCDHINIRKRPGGRIPPLPEGVREHSFIPYHEYMNAYWDLEDKGIPFPGHFKHLRRWPVAPPPREVPITKPRDD
jgi:hypothetical protein